SITQETTSLGTHESNLINKLRSTNAEDGAMIVGGIKSVHRGATVTLPLTFIASTLPVSGIQIDVIVPSALTLGSVVAGASAATAGKQISTAPITGGIRIIVAGLNTTPIPTGVLVNVSFSVP